MVKKTILGELRFARSQAAKGLEKTRQQRLKALKGTQKGKQLTAVELRKLRQQLQTAQQSGKIRNQVSMNSERKDCVCVPKRKFMGNPTSTKEFSDDPFGFRKRRFS